MLIINTLTKKFLENILKKIFRNFGPFYFSQILDSLKALGFLYATESGTSINIEDLKIPAFKQKVLKQISKDRASITSNWKRGDVTEIERFTRVIDAWNIASETLKNHIITSFKHFEPTNSLYFAAISGARGNIDQIHQLVGVRGLMSDQEGKIIDLPIKSNFREGLSVIDYVISSYGARKGTIDTALKTSSSGYLTRRLIYLAQDLVIRKFDCGTKKGIFLFVNNAINNKDSLGRILNSVILLKKFSSQIINKNISLNNKILKHISKFSAIISIRSAITCELKNSICQNCYGYDLAKNKLIDLGSAVGIIAAHSTSEPATQLTMRTFHTGGVFSKELINSIVAPFSGLLEIKFLRAKNKSRNLFGNIIQPIERLLKINIISWEGKRDILIIKSGLALSVLKTKFIKKNRLLSELPTNLDLLSNSKKTPIYSHASGEIFQHKNFLQIKLGNILNLPKKSFFNNIYSIKGNLPLATLNVISPFEGFLILSKKKIKILSQEKKINVNIKNLKRIPFNCKIRTISYLKNYQYVDKYTIIGSFVIFINCLYKLYLLKKSHFKLAYNKIYLLITKSSVDKIFIDSNINLAYKKIGQFINIGNYINTSIVSNNSGQLLKKDGLKIIYQKAYYVCLNNYKLNISKNYIGKNHLLLKMLNQAQATLDIIQGIPKLVKLFEAENNKKKLLLAKLPGICINIDTNWFRYTINFNKKILAYNFNKKSAQNFYLSNPFEKKAEHLEFFHANRSLINNIIYDNKFWKIFPTPEEFSLIFLKNEFRFFKKDSFFNASIYSSNHAEVKYNNFKKLADSWSFVQFGDTKKKINYRYFSSCAKGYINECLSNLTYIYKDKKDGIILKTSKNIFLYLKLQPCITEYNDNANTSYAKIFEKFSFVDINEPISLIGTHNPNDILQILYYHNIYCDGIILGLSRSVNKFQFLVINSIQSIYQSQDISTLSKNVDIIIKQLTNKIEITCSGTTPFMPGTILPKTLILGILEACKFSQNFKNPSFEPKFYSSTFSTLNNKSFLITASFQQAKNALLKSAIFSKTDWLGGKNRIITGGYMCIGTTFLDNSKNLDTLYSFKEK